MIAIERRKSQEKRHTSRVRNFSFMVGVRFTLEGGDKLLNQARDVRIRCRHRRNGLQCDIERRVRSRAVVFVQCHNDPRWHVDVGIDLRGWRGGHDEGRGRGQQGRGRGVLRDPGRRWLSCVVQVLFECQHDTAVKHRPRFPLLEDLHIRGRSGGSGLLRGMMVIIKLLRAVRVPQSCRGAWSDARVP